MGNYLLLAMFNPEGQEGPEEQASAVEAAVTAKIPNNIELVLVNGGQPIYSFIISVE